MNDIFDHWFKQESVITSIENSLTYDSKATGEDDSIQITEFDQCFAIEFYHFGERLVFKIIDKLGDFTSEIKKLCDEDIYDKYVKTFVH